MRSVTQGQVEPFAARGIFSPFRAGALAGVSGNRIGQWARYGLITPTYFKGRPANLYEFRDVAEGIVVHWLIERDFTYDQIHVAIERARSENYTWPLQEAPVGVAQHAVEGDPRGTIAFELTRGVYVDALHGDQLTLQPQMFERARDVLLRGGWIADRLGLQRIEVDPAKLNGTPVLRGRRWPIERVAQLAADAPGKRVLVEDYGLRPDEIEESERWVDEALKL
jgi:uncharacterized protein (DUF433 family)/DNA-binding transcriptional MerR regulator